MSYDRFKHHRRSIRLPHWDYGSSGWYYVTICTHERNCLFGTIVDNAIMLNDVGKIVEKEWLNTPIIRPNVELDDYVIMPNHVHGIIIIKELPGSNASVGANTPVGADSSPPLRRPTRKSHSLGSILAGFKSSVTKRINIVRQTPMLPVWQRNYYEHIIRDEADLHRIREYIANNPLRWAFDEENPDHLERVTQKRRPPRNH